MRKASNRSKVRHGKLAHRAGFSTPNFSLAGVFARVMCTNCHSILMQCVRRIDLDRLRETFSSQSSEVKLFL
jgi:hypothetical protein